MSTTTTTTTTDSNSLLRVSSFFALVLAFQIAVARLALGKEAKRRWQHALTGHALVQISYFLPLQLSLFALLAGCLAIAYVRLYQADLYVKLFGPLLRPAELPTQDGRLTLPGAFYFLCGTFLTALVFPLPVARYAVECLALADPVASWVGGSVAPSAYNRRLHASASVAGCLASFGVAFCLGMLVWDWQWPVALVGALVCCAAEANPWMNDNLAIPLATAAAVYWYTFPTYRTPSS
jgi:dolichol kinase